MPFFGTKPPSPARDVYLYNTQSGKKEVFTPRKGNKVTMYSCGPTVYDYVHIGNLRAFMMADIAKRVLLHNGYQVVHTMNLTDFGHLTDDGDAGEDKIMKGLKRDGLEVSLENMKQLTDKYITAFQDDLSTLRIVPPTTYARASEYVTQQIKLIGTLEGKGYTYETSDGVYFDVSTFPAYGSLGGVRENIADNTQSATERAGGNEEKKHPADFAVWKKSSLGWESRWGKGFPGWHIECSAMAITTLGKQIDIHTGGEDLQYTHHNAEIAQCECATGKSFVNYWLHNAFVNILKGEKISKSKGNAINLRHLQDRGFSGEDYRYWLLTAHYRSPVNFTWEAIEAAKAARYRLARYMYEDFKQTSAKPNVAYMERFDACLADDLDTPGAVAVLWDMIKDNALADDVKAGTLLAMDAVLDIGLSEDKVSGLQSIGVVTTSLPENVQQLVDDRATARADKNWQQADELRDELAVLGYEVKDTPDGQQVVKK